MTGYQIKVYKIFNSSDLDDQNFYIGSTKRPLTRRLYEHKKFCVNGRRRTLYDYMRLKGYELFDIELLCVYNVSCWDEQRQKEQIHIREFKPSLNMVRAFSTPEEAQYMKKIYREEHKKEKAISDRIYRENNKEVLSIKHKEYRENNKEVLSIKHKEYAKNNKEHLKEYLKEYNVKNNEKLVKQKKEYYEKNKDKLNEDSRKRYHDPKNNRKAQCKARAQVKYFCEVCEKEFTLVKKTRHEQSKAHLNKINPPPLPDTHDECECGGRYLKHIRKNHLKTKKHIQWVENNK